MTRIAKRRPSCRLNLEMSESVRQNLEWLRDETNADSLAEVIRRSLAVYEFAWKAQKKGLQLFAQDEHGKKTQIALIF